MWNIYNISGSITVSGMYTYNPGGGSTSSTTTSSGTTTTTTTPNGSTTTTTTTTTTTHSVSPSQITAAAVSTVSKMINLYGTQKAVCNISVVNVFNSLFNSTDINSSMDANHMLWHMLSSTRWQPINISQAQSLANQGRFIVAGWINNKAGHSGHVVVIVPGTAGGVYTKSWHCNVPFAMDCGDGKRFDSALLKWSFGTDKMNDIVYYMYR